MLCVFRQVSALAVPDTRASFASTSAPPALSVTTARRRVSARRDTVTGVIPSRASASASQSGKVVRLPRLVLLCLVLMIYSVHFYKLLDSHRYYIEPQSTSTSKRI